MTSDIVMTLEVEYFEFYILLANMQVILLNTLNFAKCGFIRNQNKNCFQNTLFLFPVP